MKIYVDFDDILSETALYFSHLVKKMFGKDVPYENIKSFSLQKSFSLSDDEYEKMMSFAHREEELLSYEETPHARGVVATWVGEGHDVKIITGRPYSSCKATKQWLELHGFPQLPVIHVDKYGREKIDMSKADRPLTVDEFLQMKFDFAVEDSPNALKHLERMEDCTVAVLSRPWNADVPLDEKKFIRCSDWMKVDSLFQQCKKKCR